MRKTIKILGITALAAILGLSVLTGCSSAGADGVGIASVTSEKGDDGVTTVTITLTDGTTSSFTVSDGADGADGTDGEDGQDGADGVTAMDLYNAYLEENSLTSFECSYSDFLAEYMSVEVGSDNSAAINQTLTSTLTVYSAFDYTYTYGGMGGGWGSMWGGSSSQSSEEIIMLATGSGVIYEIGAEYTYILTNFHVIYDSDYTNDYASEIYINLYGSVDAPTATSTGVSGYATAYDYGDYAIACELVGSSSVSDVAVLRAKTEDIYAVNDGVTAVTLASDYHVGESVYAIGNAEGEGISVTEGIISVDNEYIQLEIDGTSRYYRSIRFDAVIYSGNSGGGLFNKYGELVGLCNAGDSDDQSINYAVPLSIVTGTADNIIEYFENETFTTSSDAGDRKAQVVTLGITVTSENSKYVYDSTTGYGQIVEDVYLTSVTDSSIAATMGLQENDYIVSFTINGTEYDVLRYFNIGDLLLTVRAGDTISFGYERDGSAGTTTSYTVQSADLTARS